MFHETCIFRCFRLDKFSSFMLLCFCKAIGKCLSNTQSSITNRKYSWRICKIRFICISFTQFRVLSKQKLLLSNAAISPCVSLNKLPCSKSKHLISLFRTKGVFFPFCFEGSRSSDYDRERPVCRHIRNHI